MKVAVVGPLCLDVNTCAGEGSEQPDEQMGGVALYAGVALAALSDVRSDVTVYASCGHRVAAMENYLSGCLKVIPTARSVRFENRYAADLNRTQRAEGNGHQIRPSDLDLSGIDAVVFGPLLHDDISPDVYQEASRRGLKVALAAQGLFRYIEDGNVVWRNAEKARRVLPCIDYLFLDEKELAFLSGVKNLSIGGTSDEPEAVRRLRGIMNDNGAKTLVTTLGDKGSVIFNDDGRYDIRAFPPNKIIDPTGAGDTYMAGYVRALDLFDDPLQRGEFAATVATISLEQRGPSQSGFAEVYHRLRDFRTVR
jgi:sugar/nucleoside kinase (ribokinase family)